MCKIKFIKTEDNSTGLYCNEVNDIFHSKTGALTEAYEKFYLPIKNFIDKKNKLNILDVCYGIGYNSKVLLSNSSCPTIQIDALEFNSDYILLSPFIKDGINDYELKIMLLNEIINNTQIDDFSYLDILKQYINGNNEFFDASTSFWNNFDPKNSYTNGQPSQNNRFLHNIYYSYLSNRLTNSLNLKKYENKTINFHIGDARKTINDCNNTYDIVFLDAFSSQKDPTLWTIDFLKLILEKMKDDSILVSYSKSTPFRSALRELGFNVGKTFLNNIDMGTIASFNKENITSLLNEYDKELLSTRSGITYKDPLLNLTPIEILNKREFEQKNSNLISHTQFLKKYSK